jgi:hypothetical protein
VKEKGHERKSLREKNSARRVWHGKSTREQERDGARKRNGEMRSEWEGNGTLTTILTLSFIQLLDETIFYPIMNERNVNMMWA